MKAGEIEGLEQYVNDLVDATPIRILRLEPGDALALQSHRRLTKEQAELITQQVRGILGRDDVAVLILPPEVELSHVVREDVPS